MVESVASTTSFDLPVDELIVQAAEGLGGGHLTGAELKRARTALNLIMIDMQNRGVAPLASMSLVSITLTSGSSMSYSLGSDVFTVLDGVIRTSTASGEYSDSGIEKIGFSDWLNIADKQHEGKPTQFMVDRQRSGPVVNVWPVPSNNSWSLQVWTLKRLSDINASYQLVGTPHRYLGAIVRGLRFHLAEMRGFDLQRLEWLKMQYLEELQLALDEDRERIDFFVSPEINSPV